MVRVDAKDLKELEKRMDELIQNEDEFVRRCIDVIAARVMRATKRITPVDTGWLRKNWELGSVQKIPGGYQVPVLNITDYAAYVEYGHRLVVRGVTVGWVEGFFMLTIAKEEVAREIDRIVSREVEKYLGGLFG